MESETTVPVPATADKRFGRAAGWTVKVTDRITGHGRTLHEAKHQAAQHLLTVVTHEQRTPAFARDDDGALWVSVPTGDGDWESWRATDEKVIHGGCGDHPITAATVHHVTDIPHHY